MTKIWVVLLFLSILGWSNSAFACGGIFDIFCNIGKILDKGSQDAGKASGNIKEIGKGPQDGKAVEKAAHDVAKTVEKAAHDTGQAIEKALTPVREYLRAQDIPPPEVGAYGVVVFQSKPTPANQKKLTMVCNSFIAFFPRSETSIVSMSDRMITIWPLDEPDAEKAKADDCDFILKHYDLNASEAAMHDARIQHATFDGEGPYLVGWSPSNTRALPDKLVLVVDMSADNTQDLIDRKFLFWKNKIVGNPALWRDGWSLDNMRVAIKQFSDQYGKDMLDAIKLVGAPKR